MIKSKVRLFIHGASYYLQIVEDFHSENILLPKIAPALTELFESFHKFLKMNASFPWDGK